MKTLVALSAFAALVLAAPAFAQSPDLRRACAADAQKLCAGKSGDDIRQCMKANKDKVSDDCRSAMTAAMSAMKADAMSGDHMASDKMAGDHMSADHMSSDKPK